MIGYNVVAEAKSNVSTSVEKAIPSKDKERPFMAFNTPIIDATQKITDPEKKYDH